MVELRRDDSTLGQDTYAYLEENTASEEVFKTEE